MTDITIPPEARAAALRAVAHMMTYKATKREGWTVGELCDAACLAMLKAWPGMSIAPEDQGVYLPLPKENTNAES